MLIFTRMIYTFLITHHGAGGDLLCRMLSSNLKVCALGRSNIIYEHPSQLIGFKNTCNKTSGRTISDASCYVDQIVYNHQLTSKSFYTICKFIYLIREPLGSLKEIVKSGYEIKAAENYYLFRLRRMCEMILETPNKSFLTYDDLINGNIKDIESLIGLEISAKAEKKEEPLIEVPQQVFDNCAKSYGRYLKHLHQNR